MKIEKKEVETIKEKKPIPCGTVVYCKGNAGAGSFYGIVYSGGVLELENGSDAYISTNEPIYLGNIFTYWTIEKVCSSAILYVD
jgi:hypothetical protein